ncbi:MAG: hypothetical protein RRY35_01270, partial [Clostridiales bacterium]
HKVGNTIKKSIAKMSVVLGGGMKQAKIWVTQRLAGSKDKRRCEEQGGTVPGKKAVDPAEGTQTGNSFPSRTRREVGGKEQISFINQEDAQNLLHEKEQMLKRLKVIEQNLDQQEQAAATAAREAVLQARATMTYNTSQDEQLALLNHQEGEDEAILGEYRDGVSDKESGSSKGGGSKNPSGSSKSGGSKNPSGSSKSGGSKNPSGSSKNLSDGES